MRELFVLLNPDQMAPKQKVASKRQRRQPELAPGFSQDTMGPWMAKCCQRWGLGPPYELGSSEADWQAYYQERASLDFVMKAYQVGCSVWLAVWLASGSSTA